MTDFFEKGFDEGTEVKLALYGRYLRKWFPVFAHSQLPNKINLFDFFSGPGKDSKGVLGSPVLALKEASLYADDFRQYNREVNFYFYDMQLEATTKLKEHLSPWIDGDFPFNINIFHKEFPDSLKNHVANLVNDINLIFIDQYGIKYMDRDMFNLITKYKKNDLIFYISSSFFKRFSSTEEFRKYFSDINENDLSNVKQIDIHRHIKEIYRNWLNDPKTYITHFSISKNGNVHGLIFVSHHIQGIRKFLDSCWEIDKETGEANYDIWTGEKKSIGLQQANLFLNRKIELFQDEILNLILQGHIKNERELYEKVMRAGMLPKHAKDVISQLWKDNKITTLNKNKPRISNAGYNKPRKIIITD